MFKSIIETSSKDNSFTRFFQVVYYYTIPGCFEGKNFIEYPHEYTEENLIKFGLIPSIEDAQVIC